MLVFPSPKSQIKLFRVVPDATDWLKKWTDKLPVQEVFCDMVKLAIGAVNAVIKVVAESDKQP